MKIQSVLKKFIKASRKKGYSDWEIKKIILNKGYPNQEIEKAFISLEPKKKYKNQICLFLGSDVINTLEKRAKKNMFTLSEQVEDIIRRSCISSKTSGTSAFKTDDKLIEIFSRQKKGRKKKKNK